MAKRLVMGVIHGLKRDGKDYTPEAGKVVDLSQEEIKQIEEVNPSALRLPPDDSKDKTMRATSTAKTADTPVNTDPVNARSLGGDGGAQDEGNVEQRAGMNPDPKPAVDGNLKVKGAPQTSNPKPGPANIGGSNNDDL